MKMPTSNKIYLKGPSIIVSVAIIKHYLYEPVNKAKMTLNFQRLSVKAIMLL